MRRVLAVFVTALLLMLVTAAGFGQAVAAPSDQAQTLEAKIQIVWPHTRSGELAAVTAAPLANITANVFLPGTTTSVPCNFDAPVRLWIAVNNDPAVPVALGTRRFVQVGGANPYYYPVWDFNDVNVSPATDPNTKIYMYVQIDNIQTISNVWIHAANALTYLPNPPQPTTTGGTPANVVGQIQIVFPHDRNGNQASVTTAPLANVRVALFEQGSNRSVSVNYNNNVFLLKGLNNDALTTDAVNPGRRMVITENGVTYPVWMFNDVDVSAAMNTANKYAFRVAVQGAGYTSNVWIHGAAAQTFLPQPDAVTGGGCAGTIPGTPQPTATAQPTGTPQPTETPQPAASPTAIPLQPTPTLQPAPTLQPTPTIEPTTPPTGQAPFVGPTWGWTYDVTANPQSQTVIPTPQNYTLLFNADGTVNIKADCNTVIGSYTTQGNSLKITLGLSTTVACGPDSLDQQFLSSLARVGSYSMPGNQLQLMYADGNGMMVFTAQ